MPPRRVASKNMAGLLGHASTAREVPVEEAREVSVEGGMTAADNQGIMLDLMRKVVGLVCEQRQHQTPAPPSPSPPPPSESPKEKTMMEFKRSNPPSFKVLPILIK